MRSILVIRFGSLGDLCLLGWSLAALVDPKDSGQTHVTVVTKAAFAPLMTAMQGVDEVIALEDESLAGLWRLANQLRTRRWDTVIDAHSVLRSRLLLLWGGKRAAARLAKDTKARLRFMFWGHANTALKRHMRQRFDALFDGLAISPAAPPLSALRPATSTGAIAIAPGAQWDSKRWPEASFKELVARCRTQGQGPLQLILGPREQPWYPDSKLARLVDTDPEIEVLAAADLPTVARHLGAARVLVTNDSGLLHLAEAVGTPVLALFGPTVREFGYFPSLPASTVLETELSCRPCSRNGKRPCHRHDLACLTRITSQQVHTTLSQLITTTKETNL